MKKYILLIFQVLILQDGWSQFYYHLTSVPDSVLVKVNGQEKCYTPCVVEFNWKDHRNTPFIMTASASGFNEWSDTIREKPNNFYIRKSFEMVRRIPNYISDSLKTVIGFDRLLADFQDGREVGMVVYGNSKIDTIKWEGDTKIGVKDFEERFLEIMKQVGYRIPERQDATLFSDNTTIRYSKPRYLVGARVIDYRTTLVEERPKVLGAGKLKGKTELLLEWQVLDRATGNIVLKETTSGIAQYREKTKKSEYKGNLVSFENALFAFLEKGSFHRLLKESIGSATFDVDRSAEQEIIIRDVATPTYRSSSEMIKAADKYSATVSTDNGHGSGVIIDADGYILSAYHVVEESSDISVHLSNGLIQKATIKAFDRKNDVVLLEITGTGYSVAPIGASDSLSLGDDLITIGTPADLSLGQSVARGILSGRRNIDGQIHLQTDMAVSPGNSGGPVFNSNGELVGIIQRKLVGTGIEGIGFAIPIEDALRVLGIRKEGN